MLEVSKTAGLLAVKDAPWLLPHCHLVRITSVDIDHEIRTDGITTECTVKARDRTGVEMDALCGVAVALLTIWDMVKYLEKDENGQYPDTSISDIKIVQKTKEK